MLKDVLTYGTAKTLKSFSLKWQAPGRPAQPTITGMPGSSAIPPRSSRVSGLVMTNQDREGRALRRRRLRPHLGTLHARALAGKPVLDFPKPDTVVSVLIDPTTNELATPLCPVQREEFYITDTQPTKPCEKHGGPSPGPTNPEPTAPTLVPAPPTDQTLPSDPTPPLQ